jgi:hypothetical protein
MHSVASDFKAIMEIDIKNFTFSDLFNFLDTIVDHLVECMGKACDALIYGDGLSADIQPVETRRNSLLMVIQSIIQLQPALEGINDSTGRTTDPHLM